MSPPYPMNLSIEDFEMSTTQDTSLQDMPVKQLVELHNELANLLDDGIEPRTRFKNKTAAVKAVSALQARLEEASAPSTPPADEASEKTEPAPAPTRPRTPFSKEPKTELKQHALRDSSKRHRTLMAALSPEGTSFEEVMEDTGWTPQTAREGISLLHSALGYGLREEDGRIYGVVPEGWSVSQEGAVRAPSTDE